MLYQIISFLTGVIARLSVPVFVVRFFANSVGIKIDEAEKPLSEYGSIDAFFTRGLRSEFRPIAETEIVSPVDGQVLEYGGISTGKLIQAKGLFYSLESLIPLPAVSDFKGGHFVTIYLSPKDCHRIFSPVDGTVLVSRLIPGKVLPVREPYISGHPNLYVENTRLITLMSSAVGKVAVVKVAALNVSSISSEYSVGSQINKGQHLASFHLGSTVVLVFEKKAMDAFSFSSPFIKYGESITRRSMP
ncbi:MAG: phosphatidylserine decarboxylase [Candidatus Margulisbacteria bacterium]|nr:phosphatidylserine decarboxylase [Candidatus Margulisiibacteriota bacterium]